MSEDTEREQAEAVALAHMMGYADAEAAVRAKVERLEARVRELEAETQRLYDIAVATATGPERDLADLEMMAKKFDYHPVRQGVYVYWDDGQYVYRQSPMGNHITRADALALLREKGAKDAG